MAQSSSKKRMPKSVDATGSTPSPWYLDFHLPSGKSDERVHLFFKDKEQSPFKDCGVVKEINKDSLDLDMSPCLGVKVQNGDCYLLEPMAFAWESLKESSDGETMIKAGWIEIKEDTPSENLMDMFTEGFKKVIQYLANLKAQNSKKQKNEGTSQVNQKKALKESEAPSVGNSTGMVEQESLSLVSLEAPHRDEASLTETPLITPSIAVIADSASVLFKLAALQQNFIVNNVSCEVIDINDAPAVEPINEESINPRLNQQACKEDDKEIQVFEGQPLQLLETKSSDTMEVDDDASSKTCRRTEENSTKNILVAQDLNTRVHGDPNLSSNDGPTLTIILSLCGLLLRRCWQKSKKMKSLKFEHELRPGCIEFLKSLLSISNVGIWLAANDTQVMQIIKILEKKAREQFPFFMIWGQSQCQQCVESRITRPDNPGVEAFFKPLAIASAKFGIDLKRLLLIDDAPLKGCINPALNCIFPPSFNIDEEDNILLGELLPYTKALHHVNDIRIITRYSLYGQAPIVQGHDLYNHVQKVVIEWEERNLVCLQKTYSTSRLPEAPRILNDENGASSSTTGMSTRS
ncbi:hypothetical protein L7F22_007095 [Adiantum nelumboides]|nr:hypothetical protein [Adiantum nelumboides]